MSRPIRIEFPDALYHITSRGDRREDIFEDDDDRRAFLQSKQRRGHPLAAPCKESEQISRDNRDDRIAPTCYFANAMSLQACIASFAS